MASPAVILFYSPRIGTRNTVTANYERNEEYECKLKLGTPFRLLRFIKTPASLRWRAPRIIKILLTKRIDSKQIRILSFKHLQITFISCTFFFRRMKTSLTFGHSGVSVAER